MHRFYPSVQQQTKLKTIQQQPFKLEQDLYQRGSNNPYAEQLKLYKDRVIHPCWTFECKPFAKTTEHERKILINKDNDLADSHDLTQCYLMLAKMKRGTHLHLINRDSLFLSTVHHLS